jgi:hypothetical protein
LRTAYIFACLCRDRNTYQAHAWDPTNLETLPIVLDQNLFLCNYRSIFAVDNDDGSNAYMLTSNFLIWSGAKNLMGYNKAFIGNAYVYPDYVPIAAPAARGLHGLLGGEAAAAELRRKYPLAQSPARLAADGGGDDVANGVLFCIGSVAPWPSARLGLADQFRNNACITMRSDPFNFYNPVRLPLLRHLPRRSLAP